MIKPHPIQSVKKEDVSFIVNIGFISMIIVTMLYGIIRNAVSFWIPTFISQNFSVSSQTAAAISIILPITNILGTFVTMYFARLAR